VKGEKETQKRRKVQGEKERQKRRGSEGVEGKEEEKMYCSYLLL
jgi:hypothetical protein